jgi:hypothetical protein
VPCGSRRKRVSEGGRQSSRRARGGTHQGRMTAPSGDLPRKMASSGGSSGHMTLAEDEEGGEVPFGGWVHLEWRNR